MVTIGLVTAKGVNHERKSGVEPYRPSAVLLNTSLAASSVDMVLNVLVLPLLWIIPVRPSGEFWYPGNSASPYISPRLAPCKEAKGQPRSADLLSECERTSSWLYLSRQMYIILVLSVSSGTKSWTTYSTQKNKLQVLSMYTLLHQCCLHRLGCVHRMDDGYIPKDLLYRELASGSWGVGRPVML